jgi:hypothetical protein
MRSIEGPRPGGIVRRVAEKLPVLKKKKVERETKNNLVSQFLTKVTADIESDGYTVLRHFENPERDYTSDITNSHIYYTNGEQRYDVLLTAVKNAYKVGEESKISNELDLTIEESTKTETQDGYELKRGRINRQVFTNPENSDHSEIADGRFYRMTRKNIADGHAFYKNIDLSTQEAIAFLSELLACQIDSGKTQDSYADAQNNLSFNSQYFGEQQTLYWNRTNPGQMYKYLSRNPVPLEELP